MGHPRDALAAISGVLEKLALVNDGPETIDALRQHTETVKRDGWAEARIHRGIGNTPAAGKFSSGSRNERTTSVAPAVRRSE